MAVKSSGPGDRPGPATDLNATMNQAAPVRYYRHTSRFISNTGSSIASLSVVQRAGDTYVWKWTSWLITAPFKRFGAMIWGAAKAIDPDTLFVKVEKTGWFGGKSIVDVPLNRALSKGMITPETAKKASSFHADAVDALGYQTVKFDYEWGTLWKSTYHFNGLLKVALKAGYIKIDDAITNKFITEEQAVAGRWKVPVEVTK